METAEFGHAILYLLGGLAFVLAGYFLNRRLAPARPNPDKLASYECGEEPLGTAWVQFNPRFYVMGLVFLVFDVEVLLLFPWAVAFSNSDFVAQYPAWKTYAFVEVLVFVAILLLGLAYAWQRGDLDWVKPEPIRPQTQSPVPPQLYEEFNQRQSTPPQPLPLPGEGH